MHSKGLWRYPIILLLTLVFQNLKGQNTFANLRGTSPATYKGNLDNVTKITFKSPLFGKKNKGDFTKTGDRQWTETATTGVFYWYEVYRKNGSISLLDTAGEVRIEINLIEKQVNKSARAGNILLYMIHDIVETVPSKQPETVKQPPTRDVVVAPVVTKTEPEKKPVTVKDNNTLDIPELTTTPPVYHAILIAENDYEDKTFNSLPGTLRDVRKMYNLLTTKYTFDPANVDTLINSSKAAILRRLNAVAKNLTDNDNLFIFYAGHGWLKKYEDGRQEGFLIPSDAAKGEEVSFIDNQDITVIIKRSNAKHILFTADACFAGALFRDIPSDAPLTVAQAYKDKSRKLLSSGNEQAVSDESDFVEYLRLALQENRSKYITTAELLSGFKKDYTEKTHMQLQYIPIQNVDDRGGEFVFIRR